MSGNSGNTKIFWAMKLTLLFMAWCLLRPKIEIGTLKAAMDLSEDRNLSETWTICEDDVNRSQGNSFWCSSFPWKQDFNTIGTILLFFLIFLCPECVMLCVPTCWADTTIHSVHRAFTDAPLLCRYRKPRYFYQRTGKNQPIWFDDHSDLVHMPTPRLEPWTQIWKASALPTKLTRQPN